VKKLSAAVAFESALEVMAARRLEAVRDAGVEVDLTVAIRVVEPRELVAAENEDDVVGHDEPECLVEARGDAAPADVLQTRASRPETRHTSPCIVQIAASPFEKKP
jgi:hypothetical protein